MVRAGDILRKSDSEKGMAVSSAIGYSATVARCYGDRWGNVSDIFIVTMNFGSAVAYMDVIADILGAWGANKTTGLLLVVLFIIGPLSCIRQIENLKFTSLLGLCIYTIFGLIVIVVLYRSKVRGRHQRASRVVRAARGDSHSDSSLRLPHGRISRVP